MRKALFIFAIFAVVCAAALSGCKSASATPEKQARRFDVPAERLKALQEIVTTAQAVNKEAAAAREAAAASLTPEEKKVIDSYQARLTEIAKDEQSRINGLQLLLNSHNAELRLQFSKDGHIPLVDSDKFQLYRKPDGGWELADAPPEQQTEQK